MADISISRRQAVDACIGGGRRGARGEADWLGLAAAPTFALMALVTVASGGDEPDWLCSAAHGASPLNGMVPMYLLMSAFHAGPWLKVISRRRRDGRGP
jgi:hypothetical protein